MRVEARGDEGRSERDAWARDGVVACIEIPGAPRDVTTALPAGGLEPKCSLDRFHGGL